MGLLAKWAWAMVLLTGVCAASVSPQQPGAQQRPTLAANVDDLPPVEEGRRCPALVPPKPLAMPLPVFSKAERPNLQIKFVIGIDGKLHNLEVVHSAGAMADSTALGALKQWRYTPAMCNGVPMTQEGTVEIPGIEPVGH